MSIHPISYDSAEQTYTMQHDELSHQFVIPLADLSYAKLIDGSDNTDLIGIVCPDDQWSSWHPVSGGAAPRDIQLMAIRMSVTRGVPFDDAVMAEMNACDRIDGPGRFQLTDDDIKALRKE